MISRLPILVENVLLEKSIRRIVNFLAALQRKYKRTKFDYNFDCQRPFKVFVRHSSDTIFERFPPPPQKKKNNKKCFLILSQNFLYLPYVSFPLISLLLYPLISPYVLFPLISHLLKKYILVILNFMKS